MGFDRREKERINEEVIAHFFTPAYVGLVE